MNTYSKFVPNVFLAKCEEQYAKGDIITLTTKHGGEHECMVHNHVYSRDGYHYHSITREDGFNSQERARRRQKRLENAGRNAQAKSDQCWKASNEGRDFLVLGEPIKVGHHSERRHRALIERNHNRMDKAMEHKNAAETYQSRAAYWAEKAEQINLYMPESLEYYAFELEKATRKHQGLKDGTIERRHSYSLTYAKKEVNEAQKKLDLAKRLWS